MTPEERQEIEEVVQEVVPEIVQEVLDEIANQSINAELGFSIDADGYLCVDTEVTETTT